MGFSIFMFFFTFCVFLPIYRLLLLPGVKSFLWLYLLLPKILKFRCPSHVVSCDPFNCINKFFISKEIYHPIILEPSPNFTPTKDVFWVGLEPHVLSTSWNNGSWHLVFRVATSIVVAKENPLFEEVQPQLLLLKHSSLRKRVHRPHLKKSTKKKRKFCTRNKTSRRF